MTDVRFRGIAKVIEECGELGVEMAELMARTSLPGNAPLYLRVENEMADVLAAVEWFGRNEPAFDWQGIVSVREQRRNGMLDCNLLWAIASNCAELTVVLGKLLAYPDGSHPDGRGPLLGRIEKCAGELLGSVEWLGEHESAFDWSRITERRDRKIERFSSWKLSGIVSLGHGDAQQSGLELARTVTSQTLDFYCKHCGVRHLISIAEKAP